MVEGFLREIENAISRTSFIRKLEIIEKGKHTIKIHLAIAEDLRIQLYYNSKTGTKNYAVILGNERIYGWDKHRGKWHKHPFENPELHEPAGEASVSTFLNEVERALLEMDLL